MKVEINSIEHLQQFFNLSGTDSELINSIFMDSFRVTNNFIHEIQLKLKSLNIFDKQKTENGLYFAINMTLAISLIANIIFGITPLEQEEVDKLTLLIAKEIENQ